MDRQIQPKTQRSRKAKPWIYGLIVIAILAAALFGLRKIITRPAQLKDLALATVQKGDMENTISASGLVKPSSEILLTSPIATRIKKVVLENGSTVKEGDTIMELDTEFAQLEYSKLQDQLKLAENNVTRLRLNLEKDLRDIGLDDQIKNLEVQSLEAQLKDAERLEQIGGATKEEVEQALQNLKIARLQKQKLENELNFRKASLNADVRNEEIQSSIQKKTLNELGKRINLTKVKAPSAGVITWLNNSIGTRVEEGAQLVRIANLSSFSIDAVASDIHTEKIKVGLPVRVRINRQNLSGIIEQILPAVSNNTVQFRVQLEEADSELLRPNMQVDVFVVNSKKENTIYVANGPAFQGGNLQKLFILEGNELVQRELEIGLMNADFVEILSGAKAGDKIVVSDMKRYENQNTVSVK